MKECPKCQSCYDDILTECPVDATGLVASMAGPAVFAGKFRIEACLGKGGMGTVYRAVHLGLKRSVALKILQSQSHSNNEFIERFRREAEAIGRLKHANVVDVMDFGFADTGKQRIGYLAMEYLEGYTLRSLIKKEGKVSIETTADIIKQVCSAVGAAHEIGIVHRDIKPDNIWLTETANGYHVKVLDFGLAKLSDRKPLKGDLLSALTPAAARNLALQSEGENIAVGDKTDELSNFATIHKDERSYVEDSVRVTVDIEANKTVVEGNEGIAAGTDVVEIGTEDLADAGTDFLQSSVDELTHAGAMLGTLTYMSPEQCLSKPATAASDIYSIGVIAYEMITGVRPFRAKGFELITQHAYETPPLPSTHIANLPQSVEAALMKALAKAPEERQASAPKFAEELAAHIVEAQRKKANIRKILQLAVSAAAVLLIVTTYFNSRALLGEYWRQLKVAVGIESSRVETIRYSRVKLFSLQNGAEVELSATKPEQITVAEIGEDALRYKACFSADNRLVCLYHRDNGKPRLEIWSVADKQKVVEITGKSIPSRVRAIKFLANPDQLMVSSNNQIRVLDIKTGDLIQKTITFEKNDLIEPVPAKEDHYLIGSVRRPVTEYSLTLANYPIEETSSLLSLWQLKDGRKITDFSQKFGVLENLYALNNGAITQWYVSDNEPRRVVELWSLEGTLNKEWKVTGRGGLAVTRDGNKACIITSASKALEIDLTSGAQISEYNLQEGAVLSYDNQGRLFAISNNSIFEVGTGKRLLTIPVGSSPLGISPDGQWILIEQVVTEEKN